MRHVFYVFAMRAKQARLGNTEAGCKQTGRADYGLLEQMKHEARAVGLKLSPKDQTNHTKRYLQQRI